MLWQTIPVWNHSVTEEPASPRLAHSGLRNSSSDLLSATTEFTNCSPPKLKVHRMWYDWFRPKPNVRRKCPFIHFRRRNRNRSRNSVDLYQLLLYLPTLRVVTHGRNTLRSYHGRIMVNHGIPWYTMALVGLYHGIPW